MLGLKTDWVLEPEPTCYALEDYEGCEPKWCTGCGDHAVLKAVQKLCRDEQLVPDHLLTRYGMKIVGPAIQSIVFRGIFKIKY